MMIEEAKPSDIHFDSNVLEFKTITENMVTTYQKKNLDYGNSFHKSIEDFGLVAGVVRISDKFNRLKSLYNKDSTHVLDESLSDTLLDMANYCIMLKMEIDAIKSKKL